MQKLNGTQLYGLRKLPVLIRMGLHKELRSLRLKQKLALNYVSKESKLTRIGKKIYSNTFTPYFPSIAYDRYLRSVVQVANGIPMPVVTNFAVTSKCPCNCWHCSFAKRPKKDELTFEKLKSTISEVQEMGTSVIGLTGGEPLLREDLEEIIASIDERSMPIMFTTGYKLTHDRVRRLKDAGLEIPVISLDHYTKKKHDQGRRTEGIFDYALKAIELFQKEGFYVAVSFVPEKKLVDDPDDFFRTIAFFKDLGINDMRLTSPILSGYLTARPEEKLSPENIKTIYKAQKMCTRTKGYPGVFAYDYFESKDYYGCGAGYNYMFIDSQGNVCPCDFTMLSFGNIHKKPVAWIWQAMNQKFRLPGCVCYANKSNDTIAARNAENWPLSPSDSDEIIEEIRPFDEDRLPEFYRRFRN